MTGGIKTAYRCTKNTCQLSKNFVILFFEIIIRHWNFKMKSWTLTILLGASLLFLMGCEETTPLQLVGRSMTFEYQLDEAGTIEMEIIDRYQHVVRHINAGLQPVGTRTIYWDCTNDDGEKVYQGIYYATILLDGKPIGDTFMFTLISGVEE